MAVEDDFSICRRISRILFENREQKDFSVQSVLFREIRVPVFQLID
jgi:hypothetical protein